MILLALVLNGCEPDRKEVSAVCSKSNKKNPSLILLYDGTGLLKAVMTSNTQ